MGRHTAACLVHLIKTVEDGHSTRDRQRPGLCASCTVGGRKEYALAPSREQWTVSLPSLESLGPTESYLTPARGSSCSVVIFIMLSGTEDKYV